MIVSNEGEEFRLLYQTSIDDIRYSKQQQWNVIYLTLIAVGGIIAFCIRLRMEQKLSQDLHYFFVGVSIAIALLGASFIVRYQRDIERYRYTKNQFLITFSKKAQEIQRKEPEWYKRNKEFWADEFIWFILPFCALIAVAASMVIYC